MLVVTSLIGKTQVSLRGRHYQLWAANGLKLPFPTGLCPWSPLGDFYCGCGGRSSDLLQCTTLHTGGMAVLPAPNLPVEPLGCTDRET